MRQLKKDSFLKSKEFKVMIIVDVIILLVLAGYFCYHYFFFPAYLSYASVCKVNGAEILAENNYVVAGAVAYNYTSGNTSVYYAEEEPDLITIRHEQCHLNQLRKNRMHSCDYPFAFFVQETECYIKQYF